MDTDRARALGSVPVVEASDGARRAGGVRLPASDRRAILLDAAAAIVATGDVAAVSMEAVAERAGVSRTLVYKHFANRDDLVAALYERESALLHAELAAAVQQATNLAGMLRALIRGALDAQASRGATFAALTASGAHRASRHVQRRRDAQTVRFFARQAIVELGLDPAAATTAVALVLGSVSTVLAQWRRRPTAEHAALLEETFVTMAMGGLRQLAGPEHT